MNIQVEQNNKRIISNQPKNKGKVWNVLLGTLGITMIFSISFFAIKNYLVKETDINFVGTDACRVSFEILEDSLPPSISCAKLINGSPSSEQDPTYVENGSEFFYTLKAKNTGLTPVFVTKFDDSFSTLNTNNYVKFLEITDSSGVSCTLEPVNILNCTVTTTTLNPDQEIYVTIKTKAIAKTDQDSIINGIKVEASNVEQDKNINKECVSALKVVQTVYTKFSCTKEFTDASVSIGKSQNASIKLFSSTTTNNTDVKSNEVIFDKDINKIDTLQVLDPLYNYPVFNNKNTSWLTLPIIKEGYPKCEIKEIPDKGKEVFCIQDNVIFETGKNLLEFSSTIVDNATPSEDIINSSALNIVVNGSAQTVYCSDTVKVLEKEESNLECSKSFYNEMGEKLDDKAKVSAGKKILAKIEIKNKGNTLLEGVKLKDPLDKSYKSEGAQNLNYLQYKEISSSSSQETKDKCNINSKKDEVTCENIKINPGESTTLYTLLKLQESVEDKKQVINVAKVEYTDSEGNKLQGYCKDNFETNAKEESTHLECSNSACITVDGSGEDGCATDANCSYTTCEGNSCTQKECTSGNCNSSCTADNDCVTGQQSHLICQNQSCEQVLGAGISKCSNNNDCSLEVQKPIPDTGKTDYTIYLALSALGIGLFVSLILFRKSKV